MKRGVEGGSTFDSARAKNVMHIMAMKRSLTVKQVEAMRRDIDLIVEGVRQKVRDMENTQEFWNSVDSALCSWLAQNVEQADGRDD